MFPIPAIRFWSSSRCLIGPRQRANSAGQPRAVDPLDHRVEPGAGRPERLRVRNARLGPVEHPEPAWVLIRQCRAVDESQHGMRVRNQRPRRAGVAQVKPKVPRHPQVRHDARPAVEVDEQELPVAPHGQNGAPGRAAGEDQRHGLAQREARRATRCGQSGRSHGPEGRGGRSRLRGVRAWIDSMRPPWDEARVGVAQKLPAGGASTPASCGAGLPILVLTALDPSHGTGAAVSSLGALPRTAGDPWISD